jgi:hypothetical protein
MLHNTGCFLCHSGWNHVRSGFRLLQAEGVQSAYWYGCPADLPHQSGKRKPAFRSCWQNRARPVLQVLYMSYLSIYFSHNQLTNYYLPISLVFQMVTSQEGFLPEFYAHFLSHMPIIWDHLGDLGINGRIILTLTVWFTPVSAGVGIAVYSVVLFKCCVGGLSRLCQQCVMHGR